MNLKSVRQQIFLIAILLLAFYLYLGYLAEIKSVMPADTFFCGGDAPLYNERALASLRGEWPQGQVIGNKVPLYSLYLALVYNLLGVNYIIP